MSFSNIQNSTGALREEKPFHMWPERSPACWKHFPTMRKNYALGLFFLLRGICVLTEPERLFKLLYLWQVTQRSKGMVVRLVFHHIFGCGNLASFPTREEACGSTIISCGVRDDQSFKAPAHIDLAVSSLLLQDSLLDLVLLYRPLLKSLLCWFLFMFPTFNIQGPEILSLDIFCTVSVQYSLSDLNFSSDFKYYLKVDVPKFVSILNHFLNSRYLFLDI